MNMKLLFLFYAYGYALLIKSQCYHYHGNKHTELIITLTDLIIVTVACLTISF